MISRRAFLKAGAIVGGALTAAAIGFGRLAFEDAELAREAQRLGALLAPADHVAWLIRTGALAHLAGTPGRPHDPAGEYSTPFRLRGLAVTGAGATPSLGLLQRNGGWWPADTRAAMAAALLASGLSPNASDAAALAQGERWLRAARPQVAFRGTPPAGTAQLAWQELSAPDFRAPVEGLIVSEWDWVILAHAPTPHLAEDFIRRQAGTWQTPPAGAIALTALPPTTLFELGRIFERVAVAYRF